MDVPGSFDIVGCYAPVYGAMSPEIFYSPGPDVGDPGSTDGSETVDVPIIGPDGADAGELTGCYVWFEYGTWEWDWWTWKYWWFTEGELCDWYWVPTATCFAAGTHVITPGGSKPIEELNIGDQVIATPQSSPTSSSMPVRVEHRSRARQKVLEIVVEGRTVSSTVSHPIYTKSGGWVRASELKAGDLLRSHDQRWVEVESVSNGKTEDVYNLVLQGKSAYFVGHADWGFSFCVSENCGKTKLTSYNRNESTRSLPFSLKSSPSGIQQERLSRVLQANSLYKE